MPATLPTEGRLAPAFSLPSTEDRTIALKDLRGTKIVLYFYPKDDTSGCTAEACAFRDISVAYQKAGAVTRRRVLFAGVPQPGYDFRGGLVGYASSFFSMTTGSATSTGPVAASSTSRSVREASMATTV